MRLILASSSPRRAELLTLAGYTFEVETADIDESVGPGELPHDYVRRLAVEKALTVLNRTKDPGPDVLTLAADTAVIVDGAILGKPTDAADADRMLRLLSGRAHLVLTGVSLCSTTRQLDLVEETAVFMRTLTDDDVQWYVASGEGLDKAGAYGIQGLASRFIPRIEGSYANVMGLPVAQVARLLGHFATGS